MGSRLPTGWRDVQVAARAVRLVLTRPAYATAAVVAAWASLTVFVLSGNIAMVRNLVVSGPLSPGDRLVLVREQYPFLGTNYGTLEGVAVLAVAALAGANLALVAYHLREHELSASEGGGSLVGVVLGVVGAGCAACGSALLVGVASLLGVSGLLLRFPFGGLELSALAVLALVVSTYWIAHGLRGGEVGGCPVDVGGRR
ncbi:hypothetical protein [Natronobiforma cellulositropha]|uniref:hypothetical protein n=1 Tax=Natronobiforma cellulositropha TaxID=1679076 RepID=UPI0021D590EF|nr:hypothetical protein [Natronobiforma cellulositropha]